MSNFILVNPRLRRILYKVLNHPESDKQAIFNTLIITIVKMIREDDSFGEQLHKTLKTLTWGKK